MQAHALLLLVCCWTEPACADPPTKVEVVQAKVKEFYDATVAQDIDKLVALMPPRAITLVGGESILRDELEKAMANIRSTEMTYSDFVYPENVVFQEGDINEYALVPVEVTIDTVAAGKKQRMKLKTYHLCVHKIKAKEWFCLDGTTLTRDVVDKFFPDFPSKLSLPKVEKKVQK